MVDKRLANIIGKYGNIRVVDSFEKAEKDKHRKIVVFTGTDIYFTYKYRGKVFGELISWVEDEFKEDEAIYNIVNNYLEEFSNTTNEIFDKKIKDGSLLEIFIPYRIGNE